MASLIIGLAGALALLPESRAQTTSSWISETISSGGTVDWSTPGKWTPATPVSGAGTVNLDFSALTATTTPLTLQNNIGLFNINQMTLADASGAGITYSRSLGTYTMTWVRSGLTDPQITHGGTGATTHGISFASVIESGATLQVTGASTGLLQLSAVVSGEGGMNVNKTGKLQMSAANTFSGDFTVTAGEVVLSTDTTGSPGSVTAGSFGTGTVILNGGTLRASSTGQRVLGNNVQIGGNFQVGNTNNNSITFAGTTLLTGTGATRTITGGFSGTSNATTNTLTFSGAITDGGGANGITFANSSVTKVVLSGVNTYTGNTTVTGGNFTLSDNAALKFVIGANGVNNQLTGNGTVTLDGDITFDLSGAVDTLGNSWNIVDTGTLTETFGANFTVTGFFSVNSTLWAKAIGGGEFYNFDETNGVLSVTTVPEPATWALLAAGLTVSIVFRRRRRNA